MSEVSDMELDLLRRRAVVAGSGYYVDRHKDWDPAQGNGELYLAHKRRSRNEHVATVLSYATPDQVHAKLGEIEKQI